MSEVITNKPLGVWPRPREYKGGRSPQEKPTFNSKWAYCQKCGKESYKNRLFKVCLDCYEKTKEE